MNKQIVTTLSALKERLLKLEQDACELAKNQSLEAKILQDFESELEKFERNLSDIKENVNDQNDATNDLKNELKLTEGLYRKDLQQLEFKFNEEFLEVARLAAKFASQLDKIQDDMRDDLEKLNDNNINQISSLHSRIGEVEDLLADQLALRKTLITRVLAMSNRHLLIIFVLSAIIAVCGAYIIKAIF